MKSKFNKAATGRLALEVRAELGISPTDVFDPYGLAELYGVDVVRLSELDCAPEVLSHFSHIRPEVFSGAVLPIGTGVVMIENDSHLSVRRRSTVSHEMAHVVLEHSFTAAMVSEDGCRTVDSLQEDQANWLAGELLIPGGIARYLGVRGVTADEAAERFNVSVEMARWRINVSGGRKIAQRTSAGHR
jgi:hypothetical protein